MEGLNGHINRPEKADKKPSLSRVLAEIQLQNAIEEAEKNLKGDA